VALGQFESSNFSVKALKGVIYVANYSDAGLYFYIPGRAKSELVVRRDRLPSSCQPCPPCLMRTFRLPAALLSNSGFGANVGLRAAFGRCPALRRGHPLLHSRRCLRCSGRRAASPPTGSGSCTRLTRRLRLQVVRVLLHANMDSSMN
jgi:hypothetical protein